MPTVRLITKNVRGFPLITRLWNDSEWLTKAQTLKPHSRCSSIYLKYVLIYGAMPGSNVVIMLSTECFVLSSTDFTMGFPATPCTKHIKKNAHSK